MLTTVTGDLSRASAKIKSELPGRGNEAKKEGEKWASEAGSKLDSAVRNSSFYFPSTFSTSLSTYKFRN